MCFLFPIEQTSDLFQNVDLLNVFLVFSAALQTFVSDAREGGAFQRKLAIGRGAGDRALCTTGSGRVWRLQT